MTKAEKELLKRVLYYHLTAQTKDQKLVEVGSINGVNPRTAKKLIKLGLLVTDMPYYANEDTNTHVRFPTKEEMAESEAWKEYHFF